MAQSKIELLLQLKDKLSMGLDKAKAKVKSSTFEMQSQLSNFKKSHKKAFEALEDEIPGVERFGKMLTNPYVIAAAAAVAFGAVAYQAANKAIEFNSTFLNIKQLNLDKSTEQLDNYKNKVLDTAFETGIGANQMSTAFYDIQSATGLFGQDVADVAKQVGNFSIATGADLNNSVNSTTKAMKAFGLQVGDVKNLLESNAKTVQVGIVTFDELARVQTTYAGSAAAVGQSVDTANKIFAAFTSIAKNAEEAATMTKTAFQGFADPKVLGSLEKYGVKIYDAGGKMRGLEDIIKDTSGKIDLMSDKDFNSFMGDVGGPEGLRMLFGKLRTGAEDFFSTMDAYDSSKFSLDKALENAKNDIGTMKNILKNQFETVLTKIGLKLIPYIAKGMEYVKQVLEVVWGLMDGSSASTEKWGGSIDGIVSLFKTLYKVSTFFSDLLFDLGQRIYDFAKDSEIIQDVAAALGAYWSAMGDAIDWIAQKIKWIWDHTLGPIVDKIEDAYKGIKGLLGYESKGEAINYGDPRKIADKSIDAFATKFGLDAAKMKTNKGLIIQEGEKRFGKNGLVSKDGAEGGDTNGGLSSSAGVGNVTGSAKQIKNVTINVESFIKGNINSTNQQVNQMSPSELEKWFEEMFKRLLINAEVSYG